MSQPDDFSEVEYQQYSGLTEDERHELLQDETTPDRVKALLLYQQGRLLADEK